MLQLVKGIFPPLPLYHINTVNGSTVVNAELTQFLLMTKSLQLRGRKPNPWQLYTQPHDLHAMLQSSHNRSTVSSPVLTGSSHGHCPRFHCHPSTSGLVRAAGPDDLAHRSFGGDGGYLDASPAHHTCASPCLETATTRASHPRHVLISPIGPRGRGPLEAKHSPEGCK